LELSSSCALTENAQKQLIVASRHILICVCMIFQGKKGSECLPNKSISFKGMESSTVITSFLAQFLPYW